MRRLIKANGINLYCVDFGGSGSTVLLLHGLCGRGNEWRGTAESLRDSHRVLALDQRGHGESDKNCGDYSSAAYVKDVIAVIENLALGPVHLIGQSMGGVTAFLTAARRPDLVRTLVVGEATARSTSTSEEPGIGKWLARWPVPFSTLADAHDFFSREGLVADVWIEILEKRSEDGYWPQFSIEDMIASAVELNSYDHASDWKKIKCPTLLVGGGKSWLPQESMQAMSKSVPDCTYIVIPDAGHDVHLEQPAAWRNALQTFLSRHDAA